MSMLGARTQCRGSLGLSDSHIVTPPYWMVTSTVGTWRITLQMGKWLPHLQREMDFQEREMIQILINTE